MAPPKSNQQLDLKLLPLLSPLQKTAEQKKMMRLRHEDPCPPRQPVPRPYPRGLSCCSTPRCSCPATPPRAGKSPESCRRPRPVPLHQEPGSERRISRTRGAQLASDGPHLQLRTGAVVLLHAPLLVPSDAAARGKKKSKELP